MIPNITFYDSPLGKLILAAETDSLIGVWFVGQKYECHHLNKDLMQECLTPVLTQTIRWLDAYFSGKNPTISTLQLNPHGSDFAKSVWQILTQIPYGKTTTYGTIAKQIAHQRGIPHLSAQAVGNAVGRNPISILIPCHRVIGADNNLTGYAAGIDKKIKLLALEGINTSSFLYPKIKSF